MKKSLYIFLCFCFLSITKSFCLENQVQKEVQNLDHKLTTTTEAVNLTQETNSNNPETNPAQPVENLTQDQVDPDQAAIELLDAADLDQLEKDDKNGLDLTLKEKLTLGWVLIKAKAKEHFKKNGKWYLVGIVGAAGAISAYYYFRLQEEK